MKVGSNNRVTASTKMNDYSSRSHAVFIITLEQCELTYYDQQSNEITQQEYELLKNYNNNVYYEEK